jgi:hypothetical protein
MKKELLAILVFSGLISVAYSQNRIKVPAELQVKPMKFIQTPQITSELKDMEPYLKSASLVDENLIGDTRYDNQSNASIPNRIYLYDDGTIAATWTRSMEESSFFADRGTGYNYYDGTAWGEWPTERIEDIKVHRPVYTPWGENGELVVTHAGETGLYLATRENKGTGDWDFDFFPGPAGNEYILWNRAITSGPNRDRLHILALTLPTSHGGQLYQNLDGALLYSYSTDGGATWDFENEILDGMESDEYNGFEADTYTFAEPRGDVVAFVVGGPWYDLFLMKSTDGGENFDKTVIWEHPYPLWQFGMEADTFYCADGAHHLAIDSQGKVHVVFGINRVNADASSTYWYPFVDGIAYWNEEMPAFSNNLNALNPNDHPDSELTEDYNLIGWTQDVNGNGQLEFTGDLGLYFIGLSSMPQLIIDEEDRFYLVFSSVTETYDNGQKNYRHLWARASSDGETWTPFMHLTSDLVHIFDECVYPGCSPTTNDAIHMVYQFDNEPGTAVWAAQHPYADNTSAYIKVSKSEFWPIGLDENNTNKQLARFSQNYPNPFRQTSKISVILNESASLSLEVSSLTGQKVYEASIADAKPGLNTLTIDAATLTPGIYFYTVRAADSSVTKKMIIE